ncbi:acetyl-CoA carboxylase biotin carboxyl carrier protein [Alkalithermobacter paradoxus]|uniref:Biotin carboxyl carrier protein of acetyl-CoA carboxylase n=1 Tax=Alkalithermobacter paradoxus TaxID=29349 RepID=A0A1V4ICG5_9FIRM|nr:biotin carboxyl carrier protein of acetyl-CoA carboxylase [[Clostridium] thermoalcaliphilum]
MNSKDIKDLILTLDKTNINKLEIQNDNFKIYIEKGVYSSQNNPYENITTEVIKNEETAQVIEETVRSTDENIYIIKAPLMGTFYKAPSPDSQPYVSVGSKVSKGDTLCILEAMKLMNEIESDVDGEIISILVENEDLVEYNQPLFEIRLNK